MNNLMKWALYFGALALFGVMSFHAHAGTSPCRTTRDQWVVQVPLTVGYAPGAADWSAISAPIPTSGADFYSCDGGHDTYRSLGFVAAEGAVGTVTGEDGAIRHVFKTQIDGIGYALGFREQQYCSGEPLRYIDGNNTLSGSESRRFCDSTQNAEFGSAQHYSLQFYVVFYKIPANNPMPNDNSNSQEQSVGSLVLQAGSSQNAARSVATPVQIHLASFTARRTSCLVGSRSIHVEMGTVSKGDFHGVNSTAGGQRFRIPVTCEKNTSIKIGFFGETTTTNSHALALTHQQNGASGVGIELRYGENTGAMQDQVVAFNTQQAPELAQSGENLTQTLGFDARYIQTDDKITPGKADAMVTFNLIYN